MAILMSFEWGSIINHKKDKDQTDPKKIWIIAGVIYVGVFTQSLLYLRSLDQGFIIILILLAIVWSTDIFAYFAGKYIGGPKIWTKISPNKTWAGLLGGMIGATIVVASLNIFIISPNLVKITLYTPSLAVISQAGDFFESWIKRRFDVKDSGNIIPGHGGIMDRVDGLASVTPIFALIAILMGGQII
jgi:phosphatidate cytidylyltransferase